MATGKPSNEEAYAAVTRRVDGVRGDAMNKEKATQGACPQRRRSRYRREGRRCIRFRSAVQPAANSLLLSALQRESCLLPGTKPPQDCLDIGVVLGQQEGCRTGTGLLVGSGAVQIKEPILRQLSIARRQLC
jgi:hypothetical protein